MSATNGKFKNKGTKSKKFRRQVSAAARKASFDALSPAEQKEQVALNRREYGYWHDDEKHLNGGEREFKRQAGLPLHTQS